ncbi:hypothetical protein CANCADRAFT_3995 [Tortispora caseinolytica NRRL Y-17796]|uniref:Nuclear cap-binding protein subunit 2 n=1 Tax=Tortispora caseinolytica NRRL Y-17796 TaxID=767744 RepID=A0A1E4TCJ9_9ASCO|nr:hypothetical protein CANCADRAFT_3995 [Tortispora caseinolytica NRRL Y-17796]
MEPPLTSVKRIDGPSAYMIRKCSRQGESAYKILQDSRTLYVGNLSFYTSEEQIAELFKEAGEIKRIIMGLDRFEKTPCGFCFVEYFDHESALRCLKYISGTKLDERIVRADLDPGFEDGRQYGRGTTGGQVRDELRVDYDPGRGGYGKRQIDDQEPKRRKI